VKGHLTAHSLLHLLFCSEINPTLSEHIKLGLKENAAQFALLVLINAFVGGMVGMERSIFPEYAAQGFGISSQTAILSFIIAFGLSKAAANYFAGRLANQWGRRNILLLGWALALPVPFLLIYAQSWGWVIGANVLLGFSQGLAWSSTVVMKIDLVGEKNRGLAMGLNEFSGYLSVGLIALLTGYIAHVYGITPYPFYVGIGLSVGGLLMTYFWVKDTRVFVQKEQTADRTQGLNGVFWETTWKNKTLSSVTQAGLVNNLNDGMIWGLFPALLIALNYDTQDIGVLTAIYPAVWGIGQLFTGKMSDHFPKKAMLFWGMVLQAGAILFIPFANQYATLGLLSGLLGLGTALVYPTFLSAIAQETSPNQRAESIGVFRLWRDSGYVFGALISGLVADYFGITPAVLLIGLLTLLSAGVIQYRMPRKVD
jgi:MFS family permease